MEEVIDKVMRTYGMMVNLTAIEEQSARERLRNFSRTRIQHPNSLKVNHCLIWRLMT